MTDDIRGSVLLLDDDSTFRSLVADVLKRRGINTVSARSVRDANAMIAEGDPLLAIVDYRLGESDGMAWITQVREIGRTFPVIFLSGTWCDEKTFNLLRNILKVSLILKKPIEPDLFLQQIESLLPLDVSPMADDTWKESSDPSEQFAQPEEEHEHAVVSADPEMINELKQMRAGLKVKDKLAQAKAKYAVELEHSWAELAEWLDAAEREPNNRVLQNESVLLAHKLYGTSGSLGFHRVSNAAGKIEELLRGFDPFDTISGIIWSEITTALEHGAEEIGITLNKAKVDGPITSGTAETNILLLVDEQDFDASKRNLQTINSVDIEHVSSFGGALSTARKRRFDAAIIDFSLGSLETALELTKILRAEHGRAVPIAAVLSRGENLNHVDGLYMGVSFVLDQVPDKQALEDTINKLICLRDQHKPKVLTVDDDELLTDFLSQILNSHNMNVRALNRPIAILQAMEEFQPDLVLLDVMMPGLSGYDVCRMLRASEKWNTVPIVFLTSRTDAEGRAAAFHAGGTDLLSKPVLAEELVARVRSQLDHAKIQKGQDQKDPLTGLMTGDDLITEVRNMLEATGDSPVTLALILIENYMNISADHGWFAAEQVLKSMAELLRIRFRSEDFRARMGQDGFAIAFSDREAVTVDAAMQKLQTEFSQVQFPSDMSKSFKCDFITGISDYPTDGRDHSGLLIAANSRMMTTRRQHEEALRKQ